MCKKTQFRYCPSTIDKCMRKFIESLNYMLDKEIKIVACCCGHGKYPMTIVCKGIKESPERAFDICSDTWIPRTRNFYKKDEEGYYYIPETLITSNKSEEKQ